MAFKGIYFRARGILKPGVYSDINAEAMIPNRPGPLNTIGVIGVAKGGAPTTVITVNSPIEARDILRDGDLMRAIELMYDPSGDPLVPGAGEIKLVRLNKATRGAITLDSKLTLTSKDYGEHVNNIRVTVETGSVSGKKLTVEHVPDRLIEIFDNLGRAFSIQYTGAGSAATMSLGQIASPGSAPTGVAAGSGGTLATTSYYAKFTHVDELGNETAPSPESAAVPVTGPTGKVTWTVPALPVGAVATRVYVRETAGALALSGSTVTTTYETTALPGVGAATPPASNTTAKALRTVVTGGVAGDAVSIRLTDPAYDTVQDLVTFLDGHQSYTATMLGDPDLAAADLDLATAVDIKAAAYTAQAALGALLHRINGRSQLVTATRTNPAQTEVAPANQAFTFLSGGSEGANPTNADWQQAIDLFATETIHILHVCSDNVAMHAMALAHCDQMSNVVNRKERITFVGGAANETVDAVLARAQALSSPRLVVPYPGISRINLQTGATDALSPQWTAALLAGMAGGLRPEEPLTFKQVRAVALEKALTLTEMEKLLNGGVTPLEYVKEDGIFRVVQGITTYLKDANVIYRKIAGQRIADYLAKEVRDACAPFIGRVADKRTVNSIVNAVVTKLRQLSRSDSNQEGVLTEGTTVSGGVEPAFKNIVAVFDGFDLVAVSFEAHPVGEVAYITNRVYLTPTRIVASA